MEARSDLTMIVQLPTYSGAFVFVDKVGMCAWVDRGRHKIDRCQSAAGDKDVQQSQPRRIEHARVPKCRLSTVPRQEEGW